MRFINQLEENIREYCLTLFKISNHKIAIYLSCPLFSSTKCRNVPRTSFGCIKISVIYEIQMIINMNHKYRD